MNPNSTQNTFFKSTGRFRLSFLMIVALLMAACGGSGGGSANTGQTTTTTTPNPPTADALVPEGTPVLFVRSTLQATDQSNTVFENIHLIAPGTGEQTIIYTNQSTSSARSTVKSFTFDDRLILLRNSDVSGFRSADWKEVDVATPTQKGDGELIDPLPIAATAFTNTGNSASNCVAIVGNDLFWKSPEVGGGLRSVRLGTAGRVDGSLLIPATDAENCFGILSSMDGAPGPATEVGGMSSVDGIWNDVDFDPDSGQINFYRRDSVNGRPTLVAGFAPPDHAQYNRAYSFSVDNGMAFWVRVHAGNQQIELWRYEFVGEPQLLLAGFAAGIDVKVASQLDVDDGYATFVIGSDFLESNVVVLFDPNTSEATVLDLFDFVPPTGGLMPPSFSNLEIMYR